MPHVAEFIPAVELKIQAEFHLWKVHVREGDFGVAKVKNEPGDDDGGILTVDDG